jgi:hypothetical protein
MPTPTLTHSSAAEHARQLPENRRVVTPAARLGTLVPQSSAGGDHA